jgi:DNA polymerase III subunit delta'
MAEEFNDLRETPLHPRHRQHVVGHGEAAATFEKPFRTGALHHAWLITGPTGIGKASLAYSLAKTVLSQGADPRRTASWIVARSHPDLHVLERAVSDAKTGKLKSEIAVDDVHAFTGFFARTSGQGGWRVGLVDCADDLNKEGANALLKLVEEPPPRSLIFILNHEPGRVLRTLRSRCLRLPLKPLAAAQVGEVLSQLPLENPPTSPEEMRAVADLCRGSPGRALQFLDSKGVDAYRAMLSAGQLDAEARHRIGSLFANRATVDADYRVFTELVLGWAGDRAASTPSSGEGLAMAQLSGELLRRRREVEGFNLDRRTAVLEVLASIRDALKAA